MTATGPLPEVRRVLKLYLELLFRCNMACLHCYHGVDLRRPDQLPAHQVVAALEVFADRYDCRQVCFLGGEPLLYPELPEVLAAARRLGYRTEVCTNGWRRRTQLAACLPHLDLLRVSVDGGTAAAHDRLRRPGSFAQAMDTLQWARGQDTAVGVTCTLTGENAGTVSALARRLVALGADDLTLHRVRAVGNAAANALTPVTWEQAAQLDEHLGAMDLGGLQVNRHVLRPLRTGPRTDGTIDKLELAPDGPVYLACQEVGGNGQPVRFDFASARFVPVTA